jgi:hypothetical protein
LNWKGRRLQVVFPTLREAAKAWAECDEAETPPFRAGTVVARGRILFHCGKIEAWRTADGQVLRNVDCWDGLYLSRCPDFPSDERMSLDALMAEGINPIEMRRETMDSWSSTQMTNGKIKPVVFRFKFYDEGIGRPIEWLEILHDGVADFSKTRAVWKTGRRHLSYPAKRALSKIDHVKAYIKILERALAPFIPFEENIARLEGLNVAVEPSDLSIQLYGPKDERNPIGNDKPTPEPYVRVQNN